MSYSLTKLDKSIPVKCVGDLHSQSLGPFAVKITQDDTWESACSCACLWLSLIHVGICSAGDKLKGQGVQRKAQERNEHFLTIPSEFPVVSVPPYNNGRRRLSSSPEANS